MNVQEEKVVGRGVPRNPVKSTNLLLPAWFLSGITHGITYNTSMPCLEGLKQSLQKDLPEGDIMMARCGGVYCPVHLLKTPPQFHIHGSNGVYIGVQVYIIMIIIV